MLLLLAAAVGVYLIIAVPLLDLYAEHESLIASRRMLLSKVNAAAGELPMLKTRVAELRDAVDSHKFTLEGASDAIASADLEGHVERFARGTGLKIGSTEVLPPQAQGDYRRIGLRLLINGSYESLMKLLVAIETATPPLVVDDLEIRSLVRRLGAPSASVFDASLEVYGFSAMTAKAKHP